MTGPHTEQGPSQPPRCGSLSWGQRKRAAAGGFIVGAVVGVTLLAAVQTHAGDPSAPSAAVGLPVDHLTPTGGQYLYPAAVALAAAIDTGRPGDSQLTRPHGVGVVGGIQFGDSALAYLALRVETGPDQRLIQTIPDATPSTFRGQLSARLGIHHRYRLDMCGLGNEQHFDTMGGAVVGQNLEMSRPTGRG